LPVIIYFSKIIVYLHHFAYPAEYELTDIYILDDNSIYQKKRFVRMLGIAAYRHAFFKAGGGENV
jgi:hypothetical protein